MSRCKNVGDLGERWTIALLKEAGFREVKDLNIIKYNHPGGDFLAEREGECYFITVKARNKYVQSTYRLNSGYNIYPDKVRVAAKEYNSIPSWITIQLDTENRCYSAYFGTIDNLRNPNSVAVPMSPRAVVQYECLARERFDTGITPDLSNQPAGRAKRRGAVNCLSPEDHMSPQPRKSPPNETGHRGTSIASFEDHVAYADPNIRPVLLELRVRLKSLDEGGTKIKEKVTKHQRIAYSVAQIFAEVKVQKKRILIRFFGTNVSDPKNIVTNIPATHRWQHDKEIAVDSLGLIDYAMRFIEASYHSNRSMLPGR